MGGNYFCTFLCHLVILKRSLTRKNLNVVIIVKRISMSPENFRVFYLLGYWKLLFMNNKHYIIPKT